MYIFFISLFLRYAIHVHFFFFSFYDVFAFTCDNEESFDNQKHTFTYCWIILCDKSSPISRIFLLPKFRDCDGVLRRRTEDLGLEASLLGNQVRILKLDIVTLNHSSSYFLGRLKITSLAHFPLMTKIITSAISILVIFGNVIYLQKIC